MQLKEIIELLEVKKTAFTKTKTFSKLPGIYAFFYIGNNFPVFGESVTKDQLIYIGKTESSQEKRNLKTHFTSGKTGSSTIRKSIGSLLCEQEKLVPIPRNNTDYGKGKYSHFKFDEQSETVITEWMKKNLAISFYEFPESKIAIDTLETKIIKQLKPLLNIDNKNPENPYKDEIRQLRKNCANTALESANFKISKSRTKPLKENKVEKKEQTKIRVKSECIEIDNITEKDIEKHIIRILVTNKHFFPKEVPRNRKTYALRFKVDGKTIETKYIIGSKDGKSRSGILKLGYEVYQNTLKIQFGDRLEICKAGDTYTVKKN